MDPNPPPQSTPEPQAEAFRCLARGGVVVTANQRAARALARSYGAGQRAKGRAAWQTPAIHDWEGWLAILWKQYLQQADEAPLLLTSLQELSIWERIVDSQVETAQTTAALAAGAWKLLGDYDAHDERRRSWRGRATADAEAFRGWADSFQRQCHKNNWISHSDLPMVLAKAIQQLKLELPGEAMLVGFDRITPAQQALLDAAQERGLLVAAIKPATAETPVFHVEATELVDEITTCAWWLRRKLESNPAASLAVIVRDADALRGEIERTFRAILMPESIGIENRQRMPFEFSLGRPLSRIPVVQAALLLLRWLIEPLDQAETTWLTTSDLFCATDGQLAEMAALDAEIRQYGRFPPKTPLDAFAAYRPRRNSPSARGFFHRLHDLQRSGVAQGVGRRTNTFPGWLDFAESILRQAAWPGSRTLASVEFQALDRWERLAAEVAGLGFDGRRVGYAEFVTVLDRNAARAIFSPESSGAPIQIMGAFETSGQTFDAIWFLGADDNHWPPAGQPHPLLPRELQRAAAMPYSDPGRDWQFALAMTRRVAASADECVFSHSERDDTEDLRGSPLLGAISDKPPKTMNSQTFRELLNAPARREHRRETETTEDASAIAWPREIDAGGSEVLKRQSACPFQGFAVRRLGARELEDAERGLTPRDRGIILHSVLESLWSKGDPEDLRLRSRDELIQAKASGRLSAILEHHIALVFDARGDGTASDWTRAYLRVERERLHSLLSLWLDYEMRRQPFAVDESEKETKAQINGLRLNLRVDRIDRVAGGRLILDYKTGEVSSASWEGARPGEPQLPLYATHGGIDDLCGILFAQVRAGALRLDGHVENAAVTVTNDPTTLSRLAKSPLTENLLGEWSDALSALADGFLAGEAAVLPKRYPDTCKHCALGPLCRVAETAVALEERQDEEVGRDGDATQGSEE